MRCGAALTARLVGDITWVKMTSRGFLGHGNGHYLQHSKETCLVAMKGSSACVDPSKLGTINDVIFAKRKGQSQKPNEIYTLIESLVPDGRTCGFWSRVGFYLEVFGRWNNLRNNWVTIGNELYSCLFDKQLHVSLRIFKNTNLAHSFVERFAMEYSFCFGTQNTSVFCSAYSFELMFTRIFSSSPSSTIMIRQLSPQFSISFVSPAGMTSSPDMNRFSASREATHESPRHQLPPP